MNRTRPRSTSHVQLVRASGYEHSAAQAEALLRQSGLDCAGSRVLIKPNLVMHENASGAGLECLITYPALIEGAARFALRAGAAEVVIADAPLQACDFGALARSCGFDTIAERLDSSRLSFRDLRLVTRAGRDLWSRVSLVSRRDPARDYVLFDLGRHSRLEPVTAPGTPLRVTAYDPAALARTHAPGTHQYLIAREIVDADVIVNLPKLKTHKKAGLTGALKNMVGANGHKAYLPHHRKGPCGAGGDCYPDAAMPKALAEFALDRGNAAASRAARFAWAQVAAAAIHASPDRNLEGAWHGNDTLWRTVLDLQTIVHYGDRSGHLAPAPQRRLVHLTDAVVAGQGDGPLAPEPYRAGFLTLAANPAAADWVGALLLGLDPRRIASVREAFAAPGIDYPLTDFPPAAISVGLDGQDFTWEELVSRLSPTPARLPEGWSGHIEWRGERTAAA
jgi:uncharacterized protein (DUF362 family)